MPNKKSTYKLWLHLEEITAEGEPIDLDDEEMPEIVGEYDTLEEARDTMTDLAYYKDKQGKTNEYAALMKAGAWKLPESAMKTYEISITGTGTPAEVVALLEALIKELPLIQNDYHRRDPNFVTHWTKID